MEEKKGLLGLGYVKNLRHNANGVNCISILSKMAGSTISLDEINEFIDSADFKVEYFDGSNKQTLDVGNALSFRFKTPYCNKKGDEIYGYFTRSTTSTVFAGVEWKTIVERFFVKSLGYVHPNSLAGLLKISTEKGISIGNIDDYIISIAYFNGAGYTKFPDGTKVDKETGKFIQLGTKLHSADGRPIIGWFTKNLRGGFEGINWGYEEDFKNAQDKREQFFVGRMSFSSIDDCNQFLVELKEKTIPEPWEYKKKDEPSFKFPILKSYLEHELERLYYEHNELPDADKIIYNNDRTKVLFNTNLIDKFGHDLIIIGDIFNLRGKEFLENLKMAPSKMTLKKLGFDSSRIPAPPKFFQDINEIIFHSDWEIDTSMKRYEHIIEDRIERFPEEYRDKSPEILGQILDDAIDFATRVAQRNYKFIVPMYYPTRKRIQLLMPIYLEKSYTSHPDFALVLTPEIAEKMYTLETILGLDEVYQDARLIAKPEESWLNPQMIE